MHRGIQLSNLRVPHLPRRISFHTPNITHHALNAVRRTFCVPTHPTRMTMPDPADRHGHLTTRTGLQDAYDALFIVDCVCTADPKLTHRVAYQTVDLAFPLISDLPNPSLTRQDARPHLPPQHAPHKRLAPLQPPQPLRPRRRLRRRLRPRHPLAHAPAPPPQQLRALGLQARPPPLRAQPQGAPPQPDQALALRPLHPHRPAAGVRRGRAHLRVVCRARRRRRRAPRLLLPPRERRP